MATQTEKARTPAPLFEMSDGLTKLMHTLSTFESVNNQLYDAEETLKRAIGNAWANAAWREQVGSTGVEPGFLAPKLCAALKGGASCVEALAAAARLEVVEFTAEHNLWAERAQKIYDEAMAERGRKT